MHTTRLLCFLIFSLSWPLVAAQTEQRTYRTFKSFPLTTEGNGISGNLRMLVDSRLTDAHLADPQGMGALDHPNWAQTTELEIKWRTFKTLPRLPARIQVLGSNNEIVDEFLITSDVPGSEYDLYLLTDITPHILNPSGVPSYIIEIRKWASCGSGCGNTDWLLEVNDGRIERLQVYDEPSNQGRPISLPVEGGSYSLEDRQIGPGKDILTQTYRCDSRSGSQNSILIYSRYVFEDAVWKGHHNSVETNEEC